MKIPLFSKLTAKSRGRKVVRASARTMRGGDEDYYEAEPNMKLSHAFMVVLILHVVAVGGIYAFNQIKVNKQGGDLVAGLSGKLNDLTKKVAPVEPPAAVTEAPVVRQPGDADEPLPRVNTGEALPAVQSQPADAPAMIKTSSPPAPAAPVVTQQAAAKAEAKPPAVKTSSAPAAATYTVQKGDNPYKIAKKLGVSYQQLLEVNAIKDPTKLQIDQVLKVPPKSN